MNGYLEEIGSGSAIDAQGRWISDEYAERDPEPEPEVLYREGYWSGFQMALLLLAVVILLAYIGGLG